MGLSRCDSQVRRFAAEWATGSYEQPEKVKSAGISIADLVVRWLVHVANEYQKLGEETSTVHICRSAGRAMGKLYGPTPAAEFTPAKLRAVREGWVCEGLSRRTCNAYTFQAVRCFRWAVGESLVPPAVYHALQAVETLKRGKSKAHEPKRVVAVPDEVVEATVAAMPYEPYWNVIRGMVRVQRLAGLRPQHLTEMHVGDIRRTGDVWKYTPPAAGTKTLHLDKQPPFYFGPLAQAALAPFLAGKSEGDHVFTYRKAERSERVYRISGGSYCGAIGRAARVAGVSHWHPHQLRHSLATAVAEKFQGIAHAAAAIGDNPATAEAVYVHIDPTERARIEVARAMG